MTERTDTERLDWLEQNRQTVYICSHQERRATTSEFQRYEWVYVHDGWAVHEDDIPQPTPRCAIDAAMDRCTSPSPAKESEKV